MIIGNEEKRKEWTDNLNSEINIYGDPAQNELAKRIAKHQEEKGKITRIDGVYGDFRGGDAYVEAVIVHPDGGKFTKLYGCSYLLKGYPYHEIIDRVATVKRVLMEGLRLVGKHPTRMIGKRWRKDLLDSYIRVYMADLEKHQLPLKEFRIAIQELIRVGLKFAPEKLVYCLAMFLEFDNAYWQRLQDIISNLDKVNLAKHPIREIVRLVNIALHRENEGKSVDNDGNKPREGVYLKMKLISYILIGAMILSPRTKNQIKDFLMELDINKIKPDEADIYFTLNRRGYNFQGRTHAERLKDWERINKEKGHVILGIGI